MTTVILPRYPAPPAPAPTVLAQAIARHVCAAGGVRCRPDSVGDVVHVDLGDVDPAQVRRACELYADPVGALWRVTA